MTMIIVVHLCKKLSGKFLNGIVRSKDVLFKFKSKTHVLKFNTSWGFPGGAVVRNPPANAGDTGSCPGPGRSHMPRSG